MVPGNDVKVAIEGIFASTGRVKVGWLIAEESFSKRAAKILLNLSLVAGEALVRGGQLDIGAEKRENCTEIVVRAEGPRIVLDNELRSEEHTSELQSLMRISYAVFCLKKKK